MGVIADRLLWWYKQAFVGKTVVRILGLRVGTFQGSGVLCSWYLLALVFARRWHS